MPQGKLIHLPASNLQIRSQTRTGETEFTHTRTHMYDTRVHTHTCVHTHPNPQKTIQEDFQTQKESFGYLSTSCEKQFSL